MKLTPAVKDALVLLTHCTRPGQSLWVYLLRTDTGITERGIDGAVTDGLMERCHYNVAGTQQPGIKLTAKGREEGGRIVKRRSVRAASHPAG